MILFVLLSLFVSGPIAVPAQYGCGDIPVTVEAGTVYGDANGNGVLESTECEWK